MSLGSWMSKWFKRESVLQPVWANMGYRPGPALLNNEAYKKVAYVYRCVRILSECAQQVPVFAAQRNNTSGQMIPLPDAHPLSRLLHNPNDEDDFSAIMESIVLNLSLHGEAIVEKESRSSGISEGQKAAPPVRVYSHPAQWIAKVDVENGKYKAFHLRARGFEKILTGEQGAFFKMLHPDDPWRGLAPLSAAYQAADTYYAANLYNSRFFENGAVPSLALKFNKESRLQTISPEQRERLRAEVQRLHGGIDNAHGVAILGPGEDLSEIGGQMKDIFFEALMKFNRMEILAAYGVPLLMMGDAESSNRASSTEIMRMFWLDTEVPMIEDIASLWNRKVSSRFGANVTTVFDYRQVPALQRDMKALAEAVVPLVDSGVLTINEVRLDQLDKPAVPWGDTWWKLNTQGEVFADTPSPTPGVPEPPSPGKTSVDPEIARKMLGDWKNSAIMRIRTAGAKTPLEAFPVQKEAAKAARQFGVPVSAAWELAKLAFVEMAMHWDVDKPQEGVADYFDKHMETMRRKALPVGADFV